MSWIDDAKSKAASNRRRETSKINTAANKQETAIINNFRSLTNQDRIEIQEVIDEAEKQGLVIGKINEGWVVNSGNGNLLKKNFPNTNEYLGGDPDLSSFWMSYGYCWKINELSTGRTIQIELGAITTTNWLLGESMKSSTNALEVEVQIKAWLVQIFTEAK